MHLVDTADTLLLTRTAVEYVRTCIELTRIDTNESQTAYERVGSDFERKCAERLRFCRMTNDLGSGIGIGTYDCLHVERRGKECDDIVEQYLNDLVFE